VKKLKRRRMVISMLMALLFTLALVVPAIANGPVVPPEVTVALQPGEVVEVDKTVTTPVIPPKPDIYFVSDTTGSMGPAIAQVKANASAIMSGILALAPDA